MDKLKAYVTGRGGRREFWIWMVATVTAITLGVMLIYPNRLFWSFASFIPWAVFGARRLRDFGASPWWVLFPPCAGFVIGFIIGFLNAINPSGTPMSATVMNLAISIVNWSFFIYVGSRRRKPAAVVEAPAAA
ncbi:DUF805 domain-containing protein [Caulobacter sp.]|uniref:DUF805 domain-containing protein n=1 Tax=Caulobacter sp. TaxID=78 RepID=UPI001AFDEA17|nr:DUF805 domain-containing protein [Caulobacter sp.]MBO9545694.1 DUF805 domain-containing protein [Caulobacter sp.]